MRILTSLSVDEILLKGCITWSNNFKNLTFNVDWTTFCFKYMNTVSAKFTLRLIPLAVSSRLCCGDLAQGVISRSAR